MNGPALAILVCMLLLMVCGVLVRCRRTERRARKAELIAKSAHVRIDLSEDAGPAGTAPSPLHTVDPSPGRHRAACRGTSRHGVTSAAAAVSIGLVTFALWPDSGAGAPAGPVTPEPAPPSGRPSTPTPVAPAGPPTVTVTHTPPAVVAGAVGQLPATAEREVVVLAGGAERPHHAPSPAPSPASAPTPEPTLQAANASGSRRSTRTEQPCLIEVGPACGIAPKLAAADGNDGEG